MEQVLIFFTPINVTAVQAVCHYISTYLTNDQVMSTYGGISTPYTTDLPSPLRRKMFFLSFNMIRKSHKRSFGLGELCANMQSLCCKHIKGIISKIRILLRVYELISREYPGSMSSSEILSSLAEVVNHCHCQPLSLSTITIVNNNHCQPLSIGHSLAS